MILDATSQQIRSHAIKKMFVRSPILFYRIEHMVQFYNTCNHREYNPYYVDGAQLVLDTRWAFDYGGSHVRRQIQTPHQHYQRHPKEKDVYWKYVQNFDYQKWYTPTCPDMAQNVRFVNLSGHKEKLLSATTQRLKNGWHDEDMSSLRDDIANAVDGSKEYFVRLSAGSAKHDVHPRPLDSPNDIVDLLTKSERFWREEYTKDKQSFLVLVPWNDQLTSKFEFRVFVHNRRVTGVSQQHCTRCFCYTGKELDTIESLIKPYDVPYESYVADVWVDCDQNRAVLIECNPFGAHSSSGSALFDWIKDNDVLHGKRPPEFRYVVP